MKGAGERAVTGERGSERGSGQRKCCNRQGAG